MAHFKKYSEFLNEDGFATVGNVQGMGNVSAPTGDSVGSGDQWPALGVYTAIGLTGAKKKGKKKKGKKLDISKLIQYQQKKESLWNM